MTRNLASFITRYPKIILSILITIVSILGYFVQYFGIDASEETLINQNDQQFIENNKIIKKYNIDQPLFIIYEPNISIFSQPGITLIKQLKEDLLQKPAIKSVTSILDVPLLQLNSQLQLNQSFPTLLSPGISLQEAKKDLTTNLFYQNMLISEDAKKIIFQVNLNQSMAKDKAIAQMREVVSKYQVTGTLYLGGIDIIADDIMGFIRDDLVVFSAGVLIAMILVLGWIFRCIVWVVIPIASCLISVFSMMGVLGFLGWNVTIISSNFISLQIILTLSLVIHLVIKYLEVGRQQPNLTHVELIKETLSQKIVPSLFAVITTMTGFASLVISDIYPVMTFGWMMMLGVIVSLVITFVLFGSGLSLWSKIMILPPTKWTEQSIRKLVRLISNNNKAIQLTAVVIIIVFGVGITKLTVENSFINYFASSTEIHKGLKFIDQNLGGTTPMDVIITFGKKNAQNHTVTNSNNDDDFDDDFDDSFIEEDSTSNQYWLTIDKARVIKKAHHYLESQPEIGKVLSLWTTLGLIEQLYQRQLNAFELMLVGQFIPKQYQSLLWNPYISVTDNQLRITSRIYDSLPNIRRNEMIKRIQQELPEHLGLDPQDITLTGPMILYNNMLQALFTSQIKSLGAVIIAILAILLVLFRSFKLAISAIIPNLFSVIVILGLMGLVNIPLDMMTTTIAAITIGIAIDNAIHYIYRFKKEYDQHHCYDTAVENTHHSIGTAMIYTSIAVSIGFGILAFSNFIPNVMFGVLTAAAMIVALLSSLILLPISLIMLKPFELKQK